MKKIMMAVAIAISAISLNAASFTWGFTSDSVQNASGDYMDGGTAFAYLGTIATDLSAGTYDLTGATLLAYGGQNGDYSFGSFSAPSANAALASDAAGQAYTLVLVETTGLTTLDGFAGNMLVATGITGQGTDPISGATWATMTNITAFESSAWANLKAAGGGSAPEPTSGLLLLLGMAGLALKRKVA